MDMVNIVLGAMHGTKAHLVYSHEGTYLVQVRAEILEELRKNPCYFQMYEERIKSILEKLHQEFLDANLRQYRKYIQEWLATSERLGSTVQLFPTNMCPEIPLTYDCDLVGRSQIRKIVFVRSRILGYSERLQGLIKMERRQLERRQLERKNVPLEVLQRRRRRRRRKDDKRIIFPHGSYPKGRFKIKPGEFLS